MVSGRTTIGRQAVLVLLLAVLVVTSLPVSPAGTKPLNDARGVDVTRFVSEAPATAWRAIHVYRLAGTTWISVIPRPS